MAETTKLEEQWMGFQERVLAEDLPIEALEVMRHSFYAGARVAFSLIVRASRPVDGEKMTTDGVMEKLRVLYEELEQYADDVRAEAEKVNQQ